MDIYGWYLRPQSDPGLNGHLGLSENVGYIPNYANEIAIFKNGIMIMKTIGFLG